MLVIPYMCCDPLLHIDYSAFRLTRITGENSLKPLLKPGLLFAFTLK